MHLYANVNSQRGVDFFRETTPRPIFPYFYYFSSVIFGGLYWLTLSFSSLFCLVVCRHLGLSSMFSGFSVAVCLLAGAIALPRGYGAVGLIGNGPWVWRW